MSNASFPMLGEESFADLFEKTTTEAPEIKEGTIVKGIVVDIIGDYAVVDVGLKAEGVGSSRVDLQACKLEYSIVSPK